MPKTNLAILDQWSGTIVRIFLPYALSEQLHSHVVPSWTPEASNNSTLSAGELIIYHVKSTMRHSQITRLAIAEVYRLGNDVGGMRVTQCTFTNCRLNKQGSQFSRVCGNKSMRCDVSHSEWIFFYLLIFFSFSQVCLLGGRESHHLTRAPARRCSQVEVCRPTSKPWYVCIFPVDPFEIFSDCYSGEYSRTYYEILLQTGMKGALERSVVQTRNFMTCQVSSGKREGAMW